MTTLPSRYFTVTVEAGPGTVRLRLVGDLDYDTSEELTRQADDCLAGHPRLHELVLDCAGLGLCDSMGLSALLMIHRRTSARRISLHLDNTPAFLDRMMDITGTRTLFAPLQVSGRPGEQAGSDESARAGHLPTASPRTPPTDRHR
ncbi:STAS domain-containing protein [Streptomyces sp. NPDC057757]|uniref:STAS domain-containing protein n=1 Tax=Streptomyces sp. NPDC057757 TaxID=3346241 RepID=UPI0036AFC759